jgi:NADH:ubiquinone oxidoreductase subunit F (NADH-binding)
METARRENCLGWDAGYVFDMEIRAGTDRCVCGEETGLLDGLSLSAKSLDPFTCFREPRADRGSRDCAGQACR